MTITKLVSVLIVLALLAVGAVYFKGKDLIFLGLLITALVLCPLILVGGKGTVKFLGLAWLFETAPSAADMLIALKANPGSKLSEETKRTVHGILSDSIKRGQLNAFLAANNLCPSLTKLNSDRYKEIGNVDELIALRALSLGLEIMLRNYCESAKIAWTGCVPKPQDRLIELRKRGILDEDAEQNYSKILALVEKICVSTEPRQEGETLRICLDKTEGLVEDYVVWLLKEYSPSTRDKEIDKMKEQIESAS